MVSWQNGAAGLFRVLQELVVLCAAAPPITAWDDLLPLQARRLPDELARIDAYLDDDRFVAPWRTHFSAPRSRSLPWCACCT